MRPKKKVATRAAAKRAKKPKVTAKTRKPKAEAKAEEPTDGIAPEFQTRRSDLYCELCKHQHDGLPFCNIFRMNGQFCGCAHLIFGENPPE